MRKILVSLLILATTNAYAQLPDFVPLIEKYSPAVVNISTSKKVKSTPNEFNFRQFDKQMPFENMPDLFKHFFEKRNFNNQNFQLQTLPETNSLGSGMIISQDGFILTNHHVVNGADEIVVRLKGRREYKAKIIGSDRHTDIALIKIDATNLPIVTIGSSKKLKVGEWVFAIGSPFGFDLSASAGIVSAKGRSVPGESEYNYVPFIQTDVAINPGNSGGPLFNLKGEVVGVNSMIYSRSGGYMGISFSIPIDVAMNVVNQLKTKGSVTRGWLGVLIQPVTSSLAKSFNMKNPEGSLVVEIIQGSPAAASDLTAGDVILKFDGHPINNNSDLPPLVAATPIGKSVPVKIWRQTKLKTIFIKIQALPKQKTVAKKTSDDYQAGGLSLLDVPDAVRSKLNLKSGGALVQSVASNSVADKSGILKGDVVVRFNYQLVKNAKSLQRMIKAIPKGKSIPILIKRNNGQTYLAFEK